MQNMHLINPIYMCWIALIQLNKPKILDPMQLSYVLKSLGNLLKRHRLELKHVPFLFSYICKEIYFCIYLKKRIHVCNDPNI